MRVAIVNSNCVPIGRTTKKGTEIFDYILIRNLAKKAKKFRLNITAFASGDSKLPVPVESVNFRASFFDKNIGITHHKTYEAALVSKAFSMQDRFDIYHVNIGNGDVVLPFVPFVKKPVIVTMHGSFLEEKYNKKYLSLFKNLENVYFVSVSNSQRLPFPELKYAATVYHGIDTKRGWRFDAEGNDSIIWAGRAIKEKGIDTAIDCIKKSGKDAKMFPVLNDASPGWVRRMYKDGSSPSKRISLHYGFNRHELEHHYQKSKLLLFPIRWEEPFGLVMIEAMACGTPVVAFARGSVPEIIADGETGFMVNPSDEDRRGDFIIKKTGTEGLMEAIDRIYSMDRNDYLEMRKRCRERAEKYFTAENMVLNYIEIYKKAIALSKELRKR